MKKLILSISFLLIFIFAFSQQIWINEIMYDTPGTDTCTFVELKGVPGTTLDSFYLVGIDGGTGTEYARISLAGYSMPSDSYFVVAESTAVANYDMIDVLVDFQNGPDNVILLYDSLGSEDTIDALCYGDATYIMGIGEPANDVTGPLCRYSDITAGSNYLDFAYEGTSTPGVANPDRSLVTLSAIQYPGGDSPYLGYIVGGFTGIVTASFSNNHFFIAADTGAFNGIEIYVDLNFSNYSIGDTITVYHGYVQEYYNLTELYASGTQIVNSGDGTYPITAISPSQIGEDYEGQFIRIDKIDVANDSIGYGEWTATDGVDTFTIDDYGIYTTPVTGAKLAYIQGALTYSYGVFKLEPRDDNDIVLGYLLDGIVGLSDSPADSSGTIIEVIETGDTLITNTNGYYSYDYIPADSYTFIVSHDGYIPDTLTVDLTGDTTINLELTLIPTYTLAGTVELTDSPADSSGSIVQLVELLLEDTTDVSGGFSFDNIVAGDYTLIATHDTYSADTLNITFTGVETYTLTLNPLAGIIEDNSEEVKIISEFNKNSGNISFIYNKLSDNATKISIYDLTGRTIFKKDINESKGIYNININGNFAKGVYFLNITGEKDNFIKKFVIIN